MSGPLPEARYQALYEELRGFIPEERLIRDPLRRLAYGTDASFYRLVPQLVVRVDDETEVARILRTVGAADIAVTFRAAGTSLSGQAITDSVLLALGDGWGEHEIRENATRIRLQPGVIGGDANRWLAPFGRKIGPDPASINAAKVGGIAANNASGMCCGIAQNSYQTLDSMRVVLADGSVLDTASPSSRAAFASRHPALLEGLDRLARETRANTELAERIRSKFRIKNTTGYSLNALVDFEDPVDILQHLMIGSEGTLGFISEITYETVVEHAHKASALVFFRDVQTACQAVALLKPQPVSAVELMDRAAIHSVEDKPGMPDYLASLPETAAALLIETRAADTAGLAAQVARVTDSITGVETLFPFEFTDVPGEYEKLWNIRKGLFPSVGAMRETGTTVIIEDVAFEVPKLADATLDLQALFAAHGYGEAIIFGHALEGNLHFVFTQDFGTQAEVDRYHRFMDEVCRLVVGKYDGSLKGEHSTGRNMAPYVEMEWGAEAYRLMRALKALFDPHNILNPGVILNDDPEAHVKHLKPLPPADSLVDKCIECGFCEPTCPSNALTFTPRQRIVGLREIARLAAAGETQEQQALAARYHYPAVDTCAGCGLCSIACPVNIDTGRMIKTLRGRESSGLGRRAAGWIAENFDSVATGTRLALGMANIYHGVLGTRVMGGLARGARRLSGKRIPLWNPYMPRAARGWKPRRQGDATGERVVYFPSCASRGMGPARGDPHDEALPTVMERLLRKAGYSVVYPQTTGNLCCGMPFESKGQFEAADAKAEELAGTLRAASREGRDPVVFDTSPCAYRMRQHLAESLPVHDITEFLHDQVMPRLRIERVPETVAVHPTCSTRKMALDAKLRSVAEACAERVVVPEGVSCCGWAGDRGFTHPELNESALRRLPQALPEDCVAGYSTSRTCEIGLSYHGERYYRSIVYLLDRCAAPGQADAGG